MSLGNPRLVLVDSWEAAEAYHHWLETFCASRAPAMGCDTETQGLDWWRKDLRTIQFGDENHGWVLPVDQWAGLAHETFQRWQGSLIFLNAKFDLHFLETNGFNVGRHRVHDVKLIAHLTHNERFNGLKSLATSLIDPEANLLEKELKDGMKAHGWGWDTVPMDFAPYWQYAALDPILTLRVWQAHAKELTQFWSLYDMENTVQQQLLDMERRGARVDLEYCELAVRSLLDEAEEAAERCKDYGLTTPGSNPKGAKALQEQGVVLTVRTEKGNNLSLEKEVLAGIDHPLAQHILTYRHAKKIASTYLEKFLDMADGEFLHPSVNQLGARTGRMSIGRPSMQNLERSATVRDGIIPREGNKLVLIDYDQIEYRLLAHYAGMDDIIEAAKRGEDLHTATAQSIYGVEQVTRAQRDITKNATYSKLFGAGLEKFATTAKVPLQQAETFLTQYDEAHPQVRVFMDSVIAMGRQRLSDEGAAYVFTAYGRRLQRAKHRGDYVLVNYLIQGTAADVLKEKMARLSLEGLDDYLVLPVHDELVFDVPEAEVEEYVPEVVRCMEEHERFSVPLTVEAQVVDRWGDKYREEN